MADVISEARHFLEYYEGRPDVFRNPMCDDAERFLRDLIAHVDQLTQERSWQPIETAPTDGRTLLLYGCQFRRHWFGTGYYFKGVPGDGEGWIAHSFYTAPQNDSSGIFTPTHWKPFLIAPVGSPDPPETT